MEGMVENWYFDLTNNYFYVVLISQFLSSDLNEFDKLLTSLAVIKTFRISLLDTLFLFIKLLIDKNEGKSYCHNFLIILIYLSSVCGLRILLTLTI
jgi:hypothetical protein